MQAMLRVLVLLLCVFQSGGAFAKTGPELAQTFNAIQAQNWDQAFKIARVNSKLAEDLVMWHYLRAGLGTHQQATRFLRYHPDWPGLTLLRRESEASFAIASPQEQVEFFDHTGPQTGAGALVYAEALHRTGHAETAQKIIIDAWQKLRLSPEEEQAFLRRYKTLLAPYHTARLDQMLWQGWRGSARTMLDLVPSDQQRLGQARLALLSNTRGVDALVAAVPARLKADPGLAYARFTWRLRKGLKDRSVNLLIAQSKTPKTLGQAARWAKKRYTLARSMMLSKKYNRAYGLAAAHHLREGGQYADLEWLSGFIALRFLDQPDLAIRHFTNLQSAVATPISLGRAGYWLGRAYSAAGNQAAAQSAYARAAKYQSSFYGLLAAEKAGIRFDSNLAGKTKFPQWFHARFTKSSVFKAALLLLSAEQRALGERFLTHLAESLNQHELGQLGQLLAELRDPHLQVRVGKRAAQYGHTIPAPYFALHPLINTTHPVPPELMLAIARRESEFDPTLVSPAGARGLMQIMPETARQTAKTMNLKFNSKRLLTDWKYNARLGGGYLAQVSKKFGGNPILISAAYNAGPTRTSSWIRKFGDPRKSTVDVIDWIEMIPYSETRNYIMRVTESLPIYRARMGRKALPSAFSKELTGDSLLPLSQ